MTEIIETYQEDMKQRNNIRKSANNKKGGSNTMKLGNKPMSWQEINSKHGECKTWNLDGFMSFSEFKEMPQDLQIEYVNKLQNKYDIGIKQISRELFNIGDNGLQSHLRMRGILKFCNPDKRHGKTGYQTFLNDIADYKKGTKFTEVISAAIPPVFMNYNEYLKLSMDERVSYVNSLIDWYHVGTTRISKMLFHKSSSTLSASFSDANVVSKVHKVLDYEKDYMKLQSYVKQFEDAVKQWEKNGAVVEKPIEKEPEPEIKMEVSQIVEEVQPEETVTIVEVEEKIPEPEIKMEVPISVEEPDPMEFHDVSFTSDYIRRGLDVDEFNKLAMLFEGRRVKVHLVISEV